MNAFILTGGQSRRFGSDKSLAQINGVSFAEHLYKRLTKKFARVAIIGKEEKHTDLPFISDAIAVQCPLVGIYSGLLSSDSDWNFFVGVDLPLVDISLITLLENYLSDTYQIVLPEADGKWHPLCAFYHRSLIPAIKAALDGGNYRLMDLIRPARHLMVDAG
ncbi:MAG: molybdenum cofactor guanylyltransferase, partial [Chlorobiales bacterium]|nr:molybdenum cofactor guanylyltransferase [Chlorobiales bacterium]